MGLFEDPSEDRISLLIADFHLNELGTNQQC